MAITSSGNLTSYSPKKLDTAFSGSIKTALDAADSRSQNLWGLRRVYGNEKTAALLRLHLVRLNVLLDMRRPLTDEMIDFIADEIMTHYSAMNIADIWLVLHRAAAGSFGEMFESINTAKVLGWFARYWDERLTACETRSIERSKAMKETPAERSSARGEWNSEAFRQFKIGKLTTK